MRREDVARAVADAVLAVPGVARLSPGSPVEVATLFAGGKVVGLRLSGGQAEVHIVADRVPLPLVAEKASAAAKRVLSAAGDDREVMVVVDDVEESAVDRPRPHLSPAGRRGESAGGARWERFQGSGAGLPARDEEGVGCGG